MLFFLKFEFIYLCSATLGFFINIYNFEKINEIFSQIEFFFQKKGCINVEFFYLDIYINNFFFYKVFEYKYLNSNFFRFITENFNLPIFFYFGMLFIFTTIISLLLLSYYGFYGVFILNLITIIFF